MKNLANVFQLRKIYGNALWEKKSSGMSIQWIWVEFNPSHNLETLVERDLEILLSSDLKWANQTVKASFKICSIPVWNPSLKKIFIC